MLQNFGLRWANGDLPTMGQRTLASHQRELSGFLPTASDNYYLFQPRWLNPPHAIAALVDILDPPATITSSSRERRPICYLRRDTHLRSEHADSHWRCHAA